VDGGLGITSKGDDGIQAKIGIAEGGEPNTVYSVSSYFEAKEILIAGSLLDAIKQWYAEFSADKKQTPPTLFFVKPTMDVAGSVSAAARTGTGKATAVSGGSPTGERTFIIEIIKGGASGTATYRKSSDGGKTWSAEITTPASGTQISLAVGCTIAFTDSATPSESFVSGDSWTFTSTAPGATTASVLEAVKALKTVYDVKMIHIMGSTPSSFWTSIEALAEEWDEKYHHPVDFILESAARGEETVQSWVMARISEAKAFTGKYVTVVCQRGMNSLTNKAVNLAIVLSAKLGAARVHESPGFVDKFAFLTITDLIDYDALSDRDSGDRLIDLLDNAGYTGAVKYDDYPGMYFSHCNTFAGSTSDFQRIQIIRTANKIRRIARKTMLRYIESPSHAEAGIGGILSLRTEVDNAIAAEMETKGDREISSHSSDIPETQDVLSTKKVTGKVKFVPIGTIEEIEVDISTSKE
ncbi:MAG TPA: DUF2586 family protein, partial [Spirochaetota bacterium]|nr:DUF2586 family protein [Spirochaetota bacterium]